jgi:hypothetical protein
MASGISSSYADNKIVYVSIGPEMHSFHVFKVYDTHVDLLPEYRLQPNVSLLLPPKEEMTAVLKCYVLGAKFKGDFAVEFQIMSKGTF